MGRVLAAQLLVLLFILLPASSLSRSSKLPIAKEQVPLPRDGPLEGEAENIHQSFIFFKNEMNDLRKSLTNQVSELTEASQIVNVMKKSIKHANVDLDKLANLIDHYPTKRSKSIYLKDLTALSIPKTSEIQHLKQILKSLKLSAHLGIPSKKLYLPLKKREVEKTPGNGLIPTVKVFVKLYFIKSYRPNKNKEDRTKMALRCEKPSLRADNNGTDTTNSTNGTDHCWPYYYGYYPYGYYYPYYYSDDYKKDYEDYYKQYADWYNQYKDYYKNYYFYYPYGYYWG